MYGVAHLPQLMGVTALIFAVFTVLMLVALLLINLMTWPSITAVGRREPAYRRFTVPSAIAKYAVVVLVACTIPGLVSSAQVSLGRSDSAAGWSLLSDQYTLRVNVPEATIRDEQALASYDQATVRALGSLESRNGVLLSYALENVKGLEGSGYDGCSYGEPRLCGPSFSSVLACRSRTFEDRQLPWISVFACRVFFPPERPGGSRIYSAHCGGQNQLVGG